FLVYLYWNTYIRQSNKYGAPFVPLEVEVVEEVMRLANIKQGEVFYELGSGDGRLVIAAALRGAKSFGVEIDILRVLYSRAWIILLRLQKNTHILHKNFFNVDLKKADVVCLYLLQETNDALEKKLEKELKKGCRVISVAFNFPHWKPKEVSPIGPIYGPTYYYER
ncbi:MAG: hypothetical protein AAB874_00005, partial [Patescibacteria group bacterium]